MGMENSAPSTSGFSVSVKASSNQDGSDGVGFGVKLQSTESLLSKMMMGHHRDHHRPLSTVAYDDGNACGPVCSNSGANEVMRRAISPMSTTTTVTNIYRDDFVASVNGAAAVLTTFQPFDISNFTTAFKSQGRMAATMQFPFTSAQWKELERQAMIYKYMMASIPVPPDLLLPLTRNFSAETSTTSGGGALYNWRYSSGNKDSEPLRCKRTDGKKWRCSRDVAPNQKYCERHMHRGRPRSRKPVEDQIHTPPNHKKTRLNTTSAAQPTSQQPLETTIQPNGTNQLLPKTNTDLTINAFIDRDMEWVMEDKMLGIGGVEQQWPHLMDSKLGLASDGGSIYNSTVSLFQQHYEEEPLNLFSFTDLATRDVQRTDEECQFFLNSDLVSLDKQSQIDQPKGFIDAWSNDNFLTPATPHGSSVSSSQGNLSPSSLTLSMAMAAGNSLDEEMGKIQEGGCVDDKIKDLSYASAPSWVPFARGGPLAEVLHTGSGASPSNPASPYTSNGDPISPPATTVSSPSGVLHRALFSQSDSSVCNSPRVSAPVAPSEVVSFQLLK